MASLQTLSGGSMLATLSEDDVTAFKGTVRGLVILPADPSFDQAREIWNKMIDRKPGMIVQCTGQADVVACVKFASSKNLKVSVRGAGHNIAGKSLQDDCICIDLSQWRSVHVFPETKTIIATPGATIGDVDHETKEYGLALPMGINSTTGIAGLTLGGGFGWLSRKYGMTCDSLKSADVVTADGTIVHCNETENEDLFWGLRGGGGNFGIVTKFEYNVYSVGPMVTAGPIVFPLSEAAKVLKGVEAAKETCPEEFTPWSVIRQCPPFPFVPEEHHFKPVLVLAVCWCGADDAADAALKPYKEMGESIGNGVGPCPLSAWNQAFDPLLTAGVRNYWKTCNLKDINAETIDIFCKLADKLPNFGTEIFIVRLGGATKNVPLESTAYCHRMVPFLVNCHTRWEKPEEDEENKKFARDMMEQLKPFGDGTSYSNFVSEGDEAEVDLYGVNMTRLTEVKKKYDPNNFFSVNYNIRSATTP